MGAASASNRPSQSCRARPFSYGPTIQVLQANVTTGDEGTTVYFNYGATSGYGSTSATYTIVAGQTVVQIPISGLTLGDTYHFQAVVTNSVGTTDRSDATFTTVGMPSEIGGGLGYGALGGSGLGFQPSAAGTTPLLPSAPPWPWPRPTLSWSLTPLRSQQ